MRTKNMWCKDSGCIHYDQENDCCTRTGKDGATGTC